MLLYKYFYLIYFFHFVRYNIFLENILQWVDIFLWHKHTQTHIIHIHIYNMYFTYCIYLSREITLKCLIWLNNACIVYKYSCIGHCFFRLNPHIYFQFPSLYLLVVIDHWLNLTGVSSCLPPLQKAVSSLCTSSSYPPRTSWSVPSLNIITSLFLALPTARTSIHRVVCSGFGQYQLCLSSLSCLSHLLSGKSISLEHFYIASAFQRGMKKLRGMVPVRNVSHRQPHFLSPPPSNSKFSLPKTASCFFIVMRQETKQSCLICRSQFTIRWLFLQ